MYNSIVKIKVNIIRVYSASIVESTSLDIQLSGEKKLRVYTIVIYTYVYSCVCIYMYGEEEEAIVTLKPEVMGLKQIER